MAMNRSTVLIVVVVVAAFGLSAAFYSGMPERVITHWDAAGRPNGYSSRFWGAYLMPMIMSWWKPARTTLGSTIYLLNYSLRETGKEMTGRE
jgi:uncharacterized membrane protein